VSAEDAPPQDEYDDQNNNNEGDTQQDYIPGVKPFAICRRWRTHVDGSWAAVTAICS
jgi:hypothetical protein